MMRILIYIKLSVVFVQCICMKYGKETAVHALCHSYLNACMFEEKTERNKQNILNCPLIKKCQKTLINGCKWNCKNMEFNELNIIKGNKGNEPYFKPIFPKS